MSLEFLINFSLIRQKIAMGFPYFFLLREQEIVHTSQLSYCRWLKMREFTYLRQPFILVIHLNTYMCTV